MALLGIYGRVWDPAAGRHLERILKCCSRAQKLRHDVCSALLVEVNKRCMPLHSVAAAATDTDQNEGVSRDGISSSSDDAQMPGEVGRSSLEEEGNCGEGRQHVLDSLDKKLQHLKRREASSYLLRAAALTQAARPRRDTEGLEGSGRGLNSESRMRDLRSVLDGIPDSLLSRLQVEGLKSSVLKKTLFKQTLDFGFVFRERAVKNAWYYLHEVGLSEDEVVRTFVKDPHNVNRDHTKTVGPMVKWLLSLGMEWDFIVGKIMANPACKASLVKLKANYMWMRDVGLTEEMCLSVVRHQPTILCGNLETLNKKLMFAILILNKDMYDVFKCPSYLTFSFEKRIMLRTAFCVSMDIDLERYSFGIFILSPDKDFCRLYLFAAHDDKGALLQRLNAFKAWWNTLESDEQYSWIIENKKSKKEKSRKRRS